MIDVVRILRETSVVRAEYRPTLVSTNDRAAQCAALGVKDLPLVVVADQQTAGRGRGSNRWWTGPGALAFSLLVDAETVAAGEGRSPLMSLAAAVAVADVVAPLLPDRQVGLYWPNDVIVRRTDIPVCHRRTDIPVCQNAADIPVCQPSPEAQGRQECLPHQSQDRKLAGILVEVLPDRRHVIGIGLNTNNTAADAPAELQATVATLRDLSGRAHDQTALLIDLLRRLEQEFARLRSDAKSVAARADELCLDRGRSLTLRWGDRAITGLCRGIAADGAIRLETAGGEETFCSGTLERA
jgi:BirA family transcriptional regulator, biotin operon repressor / biotin---[acetyl-CoA-carboxylase] ligase